MMPQIIHCPYCKNKFYCDEDDPGKPVCSQCAREFEVTVKLTAICPDCHSETYKEHKACFACWSKGFGN